MNIPLHPFLDTMRHASTAAALSRWYDERPGVVRLWAIQPDLPAGASTLSPLHVLLLLEPSADGDEIAPAWVARAATWSRELEQRLSRAVQLECLDIPVGDDIEVDAEGTLLASLCWRDATMPVS